jgi:hypothetical protein
VKIIARHSDTIIRDMRVLYRQRLFRVLSSRPWTCSGCQQHRIRQFTTSNSTLHEGGNTLATSKPNNPLDAATADVEGGTVTHKRQEPKRTHLKNSGQYFVTTPIFYVNGGTFGHPLMTECRSTCRTYAFNGDSRCA